MTTEEDLEGKLYALARAYWILQEGNYDIEWNYEELLDFDFAEPGLEEKLDEITARCNQIKLDEKPLPDPAVASLFRQDNAPVPNNTVINVVARAIMAGGNDYLLKSPTWQVHAGEFSYEVKYEKAGTITVTIADCGDQAAFVQSLSPLTLDVLVGLVGHLCSAYCEDQPDNPLSLKTYMTARRLLQDKRFRSFGEKRWAMIDKIHEEMEKLGKIRISVQDAFTREEPHSYESRLAIITPVKRDYNRYSKMYTPTAWEIQPGNWAVYNMSRKKYRFIGKLDQAVLAYDHREQRSTQFFAKKLVYALFIISGGVYYLKNGVRKTLRQYLELIGEFRPENDASGKIHRKALQRLADAIDFLVDEAVITTNIDGRVADFIKERSGPWQLRRLLDAKVEIKVAGIK